MSELEIKTFNTGLNIKPIINPLGFEYGEDCFGPEVENRKLSDIRKSLLDHNCTGPEIVYAIAMDVGKKVLCEQQKKQHLLFGLVTYATGKLGKEPIRSQGHIHKNSVYSQQWSTPEVYQIWSGKAIIYMQEYAEDNPGKCYAVFAEPGNIVIVPPFWAHATISADNNVPLTFGAWCVSDYAYEYDKIRLHSGLAWYPLIEKSGEISWSRNPLYEKKSDLIIKGPHHYSEFKLNQNESVYLQYEKNPELFSFVPKPFIISEIWRNFIP